MYREADFLVSSIMVSYDIMEAVSVKLLTEALFFGSFFSVCKILSSSYVSTLNL